MPTFPSTSARPLCTLLVAIPTVLALACTQSPEPIPEATESQDPAPPTVATLEKPNILLIDIDSLRADRVHAEHDGTAVAPVLRNMSKNGAHFAQAYAQSGWTMPSLAALLTGRYPVVAPVGGGLQWIENDTRTLPEIFGMYDYHTAVFWGGTLASDYQGPSKGFDEVHRKGEDSDPAYHQPIAHWLRNDAQEPFFAFVHNLDLHAPVPRPPAQAVHRWHPSEPACDDASHLLALQRDLEDSLGQQGSIDHVIGHYDATLLHYNHSLRVILEALKESGMGLRTVVVITSNHGEDLYEHGTIDHSLLYDTVLHVPLLIRDPTLPQIGTRVSQPVQAIDLAPTLLERVGIPVDQNMDGQSLLPLLGMGEGSYEPRPHYAMTSAHNAAVRTDDTKLILTNFVVDKDARDRSPRLRDEPAVVPHLELYDLIADPDEQHNLIDEQPERAATLESALEAWLLQQAQRAEGGVQLEVNEHAREVLQERGYWDLVKPEAPEER